jgi:Family of unknown function (DUF6491)
MHAILLPLVLWAAAGAASVPQPEEARIPFLGFRSIHTFHPVGNDVVYLQDVGRHWYRATLTGPCINLQRALRIGVDTRFTGDTLDNSSTFIVDGERCPIHSLVRSDPPPPRRRHGR